MAQTCFHSNIRRPLPPTLGLYPTPTPRLHVSFISPLSPCNSCWLGATAGNEQTEVSEGAGVQLWFAWLGRGEMRDDNFWSRATPGDPWRGRRSSSRRWNFGCSPSLPTPPTSLSVTARDGSYKKKGSLHPYARLSLASGGILIEPVYWRAYRRLEPRCQTILILQVCPTSSDRETFTPMTSSCSRASRNLSPPPTAHTTPLSWNPVPINSRPVYDARSIKEIPPTIPQEGKLIADMTVAPGERYCVCLLLQCVWCV